MHEKKLLCCLITAASKVIGVTTPIGWDRCEGSLQRIGKAGISGTSCIPAESYTCLTILPKPLSEREIFAKTNLSHQRTVTFFFFFFSKRTYEGSGILSLTNCMTLWINLYMQ